MGDVCSGEAWSVVSIINTFLLTNPILNVNGANNKTALGVQVFNLPNLVSNTELVVEIIHNPFQLRLEQHHNRCPLHQVPHIFGRQLNYLVIQVLNLLLQFVQNGKLVIHTNADGVVNSHLFDVDHVLVLFELPLQVNPYELLIGQLDEPHLGLS